MVKVDLRWKLIYLTSFFQAVQTKQELLTSLGLQEEVGSAMEFFRRGYKVGAILLCHSEAL